MVEIGVSLALQGKSAPESKLTYPADPSTHIYIVDLGLDNPSPTSISTRRNCSF